MEDTIITSTPISKEKWFQMTLADQLANVGSEFFRSYQAKKNNLPARFEPAFIRFLELINLTIQDPRWTGLRKQELARLKENIVENLYTSPPNLEAIAPLEKYFYYFGIARKKEIDNALSSSL